MTADECVIILPDFLRWLKVERDVSDSTYTHHKYTMQSILQSVETFDETALRDYIYDQKQRVKSGTIEHYIYTIRVFCEYLVFRGDIAVNWGRNIPLPKHIKKVPVILTVLEVEAILRQDLPASYHNYQDAKAARNLFDSFFSLLARTGARYGEVAHMTIGDVNWIEKTWSLNDTKTRVGRIIPLPEDSVITLRKLAGDRKLDELLFTNPRTGLILNSTVAGRYFKQRMSAAGVKKNATVHSLRHAFIVEMFKQDVSPLKIANIVGHENIKTTQDYARLLIEDLRDAMMRHPLTAKSRNPHDIIKHIKDTVEHFRLKEDGRFFYELSEGNDGIRISVFVR